ncbi:FAD-dependent oxidoreductase [Kribbella sp. NPDC023972]|uniref:NAD(P)/FAD-dependent oxidoreductase n=1 Tax=Kribbella sp. NPDC023972 TaxID=3154795 RepID=UPI0033CDBC9B
MSAVVRRVCVVGASLAGLATARALRTQGYDGELVVVGDERHRPYDRPPLSKDFLTHATDIADLTLEADGEDLGIEWRLGTRAVGLEAGALDLDDGSTVSFDGLVIATGAGARADLPGAGLDRVHLLRTLDDAVALREDLRRGGRVVVVGGGYIGSEVAATARATGSDVTLLVPDSAPLRASLGPFAGTISELHRRHGVKVMTHARVSEVRASGDWLDVVLADRWHLPADTVVLGIGATPAIGWLGGSGLELGDGILCDAFGATSLPGVVAVGDCSAWFDPALGRHQRVEHWTSALDRAPIAARTLLGGDQAVSPRRAPYLWSDIHGSRIQLAGHAELADGCEVETGSVAEGSFVAVYRRGGQPVAVLGIDQPKHFMSVRRQLASIPAFPSLQGATA